MELMKKNYLLASKISQNFKKKIFIILTKQSLSGNFFIIDEQGVESGFETYLKKTISIRDTFVRKEMKENYFHGILIGLLGVKETWGVSSNPDMGDGTLIYLWSRTMIWELSLKCPRRKFGYGL